MPENTGDTPGADALKKLASLARLGSTEAENRHYAEDMRRILTYVAKLEECDVDDVQPTTRVGSPGTWREDVVVDGLPLERALHNAPERIGDGFGVPKIIE